MSSLIHIGFDNSCRLWKRIFYFEYRGIRYKLIQNNPKKWSDVLVTITEDRNTESLNRIYLSASEFISALSWQNQSRASVQIEGSYGIKDLSLAHVQCHMFSSPRIPNNVSSKGYTITIIPYIENASQRDALALFREASAVNSDYLAFLYYWQIFSIENSDGIGWINKTLRKKREKLFIFNDELERLPLNGKSLGNYFYDDCRNAVAHIYKKEPGRISIKIDSLKDRYRFSLSNRIIKEFAKYYITDFLKLNKRLHLVRKGRKGFPVYLNEETIATGGYQKAYEIPKSYYISMFSRK